MLTKTLSYSNVMYIPRVPLILLTVEKIECEKFDFALVSFFFACFLSFPSYITQKLYSVYKRSAYQTTALLSEIFLFCSLFPICPFVHTYMHNSKPTGRVWTFYIYSDCSTIGDVHFGLDLHMRYDWQVMAPNLHDTLFSLYHLCVLTCIT